MYLGAGSIDIAATKDGKEICTQTDTRTPGSRVKLAWNIDSRRARSHDGRLPIAEEQPHAVWFRP